MIVVMVTIFAFSFWDNTHSMKEQSSLWIKISLAKFINLSVITIIFLLFVFNKFKELIWNRKRTFSTGKNCQHESWQEDNEYLWKFTFGKKYTP